MDDGKKGLGFYARLSLRPKVTAVLLALSLLPLLITGIVNVHRANERGKVAEHERQTQAVRFAAGALERLFFEIEHDVRTYARRFPAERIDLAEIAKESHEKHNLLPHVGNWTEAEPLIDMRPHYGSLFLADREGHIIYFYPYRPLSGPIDIVSEKSLTDLPARGGMFIGQLDLPQAPTSLFVAAPISKLENPEIPEGYFGVVTSVENLDMALRATLEIAAPGPQSALLLFDAANRVVMQYNLRSKQNLSELALRERALGVQELPGEDLLLARVPIGRTGFDVAMVISSHTAYHDVHVLIWMFIIAILFSVVFVVLLADRLAENFVAPLKDLERGVEMIGEGELEHTLEVTSEDEIGHLAGAFNKMTASLLASKREAEAATWRLGLANQSLDAMIQTISLDMRKKLRGIEGFSSFIKEEVGAVLDEDGNDLFNLIDENVIAIDRTAEDLVRVIEQQRVEQKPTLFSMYELAVQVRQSVLTRRRKELERKKGAYAVGEILIQIGMPEVFADRQRMALILEKLIDNGLKFNRQAAPVVQLNFEDDGLDWFFVVQDNGIGIDPAYHEKIFEMFTRLEHGAEFAGSGTSLNLVRRILQDHRGDIHVESEEGKGSRFIFTLPKDSGPLGEFGYE